MSPKKLLELINEFSKVAEYKTFKHELHFYRLTMNDPKKKLRILLTIISKRIKYLEISLTKEV